MTNLLHGAGDNSECYDYSDEDGCAMYDATCTDSSIAAGAATDDFGCYSYGGQSGSPVWLKDSNGTVTIRGVLIPTQTSSTDSGSQSTAAPARFLIMTQEVFQAVQTAMSQAPSDD